MSEPTLTEFLLARIAEDERSFDFPGCVSADSVRGESWMTPEDCPWCGWWGFDGTEPVIEDAWSDHVDERHNRRRVLAECAAKRRIVEFHAVEHLEKMVYDYSVGKYLDAQVPYDVCSICIDLDYEDERGGVVSLAYPCPTIGALVAIYAEHADYRPEWAECIKTDPPPSLQ